MFNAKSDHSMFLLSPLVALLHTQVLYCLYSQTAWHQTPKNLKNLQFNACWSVLGKELLISLNFITCKPKTRAMTLQNYWENKHPTCNTVTAEQFMVWSKKKTHILNDTAWTQHLSKTAYSVKHFKCLIKHTLIICEPINVAKISFVNHTAYKSNTNMRRMRKPQSGFYMQDHHLYQS